MKDNSEIIDFFKEVQRVISKHGLDFVLNHLKQIQESEGDEKVDDICEYILAITSNHYEVIKEDVKNSKKRGKISESRRMCFALMKEHLLISDEKIGDYFNSRSRQYVNKELLSLPLNQDSFTTKNEKSFVQDFIKLSTEVLKYRNSYELTKQ
jgi:hypothetical protein